MSYYTNCVAPDPYVVHMQAELLALKTNITDETNLLVGRVHFLRGNTKAAERGIYVGEDEEANMYRAMISEFKEKANV